ncbi:transposase [Desulfococcaceae bacterium HSG8]|nr:transposase [Desulfococcaceae bacterium HSG8]
MYEYIGLHNNEDIAVLTDSGYDNKKIQNTVLSRGWHFITALKSSRGLKSEAKYAKTPKSRGWDRTDSFFRNIKKVARKTVRVLTDDQKRKRKEFSVRHTEVFLKGVGKITAVCSELKKKKRGGCLRYIACSYLKASPRQILIAYRFRWKIEIFHKNVKMHPDSEISPQNIFLLSYLMCTLYTVPIFFCSPTFPGSEKAATYRESSGWLQIFRKIKNCKYYP